MKMANGSRKKTEGSDEKGRDLSEIMKNTIVIWVNHSLFKLIYKIDVFIR